MEVLNSQSQSPTQSKLALENVLGMKGGDGDSSYVNNSLCQLKMVQALKPILERSIHENMRFEFNRRGILRIADFGCGTGQNTLVVADTIVRALQCSLEEREMPEFEVYFTDLPSNDFNLLSYFAAAVCGSHFKRLFPQKSLHFCHSSASLHWISQVPESVQQRRSPRVYVSNDCEGIVGAAYLHQFNTDFTAFLNARAREIVDGGSMFISLVGRNAGTQLMEEQGILGNIARHLEYAFEELVNEDIVEREKWKSFYIPWFGPSLEEVESIVKKEGSFEIGNMRVLGGVPMHPMTHWKQGEEKMFGIFVANQYRALFENIIEVHLGSERLTDEFFLRIAKRASTQFEEYIPKEIELVVALLIKNGAHNNSY
ncbi:indole-3-acetate O-methyltransferase 1-like [Cryptomeria japonica]|uniref:indole-3-acetate O-methyltransferase 1-like n=1 Tax=Cryptomeria japonica TaxID=3369 RepID=UPI0027DA18E5|nr:indole-3-acetate O-methyltransferase 1-like [Cryptomeria japonica]